MLLDKVSLRVVSCLLVLGSYGVGYAAQDTVRVQVTTAIPGASTVNQNYDTSFTVTSQLPFTVPGITYSTSATGGSFTRTGGTCTGTLAANANCTVTGRFTPTRVGTNTATLTTTFLNRNVPVVQSTTSTATPGPELERFAYVGFNTVGQGPAIQRCNVNATTGNLSGCTTVVQATDPSVISLTLNPAGTKLYYGDDATEEIDMCDIDADTGNLSNCVAVLDNVVNPIGLTFNTVGTKVYYINDSALIACDLDEDGTFNNCGPTPVPAMLGSPRQVVINTADTRAYVANSQNNAIYQCNVGGTGSLVDCAPYTDDAIDEPDYLAFSPSNAYLYSTNNGTPVVCNVSAANGALGTCRQTQGGFDHQGAAGIAINATDSLAYVVNRDTKQVVLCDVSNSGDLANCETSVTFGADSTPQAIALYG